jgi:uroporphyrinogen decarboxylase
MSQLIKQVPLKTPQPDGQRFVDTILGRVRSAPPLIEYLIDDVVQEPIVTDLLGRTWVPEGADRDSQRAYLDNFIQVWYRMGYDFVRFERGLPLPFQNVEAADTALGSSRARAWREQHHGAIATWDDFERYPWPTIRDMDFFGYEYINSHLPDGMGLICCHAGGLFEHLSWIMSYEGLCLALYDNPKLVQAMSDRLGELFTAFNEHLLTLDRVIAIFPGDDMGFRTSTLVAPEALRQYALPWHKRWAAMTHARGLPYFLHSCGNLKLIIEDLIEDVQIDAKHSYEDAIIPVWEFQAQYGDRIGVLGGVDLNILGAGTPQQVRQRARFLLETCGGRGRYALGAGNSIPSYIPVENYLAMVDERADFAGGH